MPIGDERLYGREGFIKCVGDALEGRRESARPRPVVLVAGPRGSGGTALIGTLWRNFHQSALSAQLDLDAAQGVDDIVFAAMHGLRRKVPWIASVRFARLRLAFKALSYTDDGGGRAAFDTRLGAGWGDAGVGALDRWAGRVASLLPSLEQQMIAALLAEVARQVFSGLDRARDAAALAWFARSSAFAGPGSGQDALWNLYRAYHDGADATRRDVDKTLCAALLADMSVDYSRHRLFGRPKCLLLADNAGNRVATDFLDLLEECRRTSAQNGEPADPLLVVAVRRTQPPRAFGEPVDCADKGLDLTAAHGWWCPVRLTDLTPDNVVDLLSPTAFRMLRIVRHDADFVHALTGGHPAATQQVVRLLAQPAADRDLSARTLLESTAPGDDDREQSPSTQTVEDALVRRLLAPDLATDTGGLGAADSSALLDAMAACAVTEDLKLAACQAVFAFMRWPWNAVDVRREFEIRLWLRAKKPGDGKSDVEPDGKSDGEPRLHPLMALLLRRRLARSPDLWREVHQGYAAHFGGIADEVLRQYHTLALIEPARLHELPSVVKYLESELDQRSTQDWLRVLDRVSAAPNRLRSTRDPRLLVASLAGHAQPGERRRVITRLAVAHWLYHDRVFDPDHRLAQIIANEYDNLAQLPGPDAELFYQGSAKYRQIEKEWE